MFPKYIALCGAPGSGKTEVQRVLKEKYGVVPVDDAVVLREAAKCLYGLDDWHVYTQEGKMSFVTVCGKDIQVRDILGRLGNDMEKRHGPYFMPERALASVRGNDANFSFGSVRRNQGVLYKRAGGLVVEIIRPSAAVSPYEFDQYDKSLIDFSIINDGDLVDLEHTVDRFAQQVAA